MGNSGAAAQQRTLLRLGLLGVLITEVFDMSFTIKEGTEPSAIAFEHREDAQAFVDDLNAECGVPRYRVVPECAAEQTEITVVRNREHLAQLLDRACNA